MTELHKKQYWMHVDELTSSYYVWNKGTVTFRTFIFVKLEIAILTVAGGEISLKFDLLQEMTYWDWFLNIILFFIRRCSVELAKACSLQITMQWKCMVLVWWWFAKGGYRSVTFDFDLLQEMTYSAKFLNIFLKADARCCRIGCRQLCSENARW